MQARIRKLLEEIALKHNKPVHVIEEIWLSQYRVLRDSMASMDFPTVKLPAWGKYIPSQDKLNKIDYEAKSERRKQKYGESENNQDNPIQGTE